MIFVRSRWRSIITFPYLLSFKWPRSNLYPIRVLWCRILLILVPVLAFPGARFRSVFGDLSCAQAVAPCASFDFGLGLDDVVAQGEVQKHSVIGHDGETGRCALYFAVLSLGDDRLADFFLYRAKEIFSGRAGFRTLRLGPISFLVRLYY